MVIDAFTFGFEEDILNLRLSLLYDYVDAFVIVESAKTQSLLDKPLVFKQNRAKYLKYLDKIVHVIIPAGECDGLGAGAWQMENFQRNAIERGLESFRDSDAVMISDVDEIPSREIVRHIRGFPNGLPRTVEMSHRVFYANLEYPQSWRGTVVAQKKDVINVTPQGIRNAKDAFAAYEGINGWHLSYMGGKQAVYRKFLSCIEPLDKTLIPPFEDFSREFDRKIRDGGSFLFSDRVDDSKTLVKNDNIPFAAEEYPNLIWRP